MTRARRLVSLTVVLALTLASWAGAGPARAQAPAVEEIREELGASYETAKAYPSLTPRSFIKVAYEALQPPEYRLGNLARPDQWVIRLGDRELLPERVDLTTASGLAYLYLRPGSVRTGDTIEVGVRAERQRSDGSFRPVIVMHPTPVPVTVIDPFTLVIDPGFAPDQELRDGTKKDVGRLTLTLDVPSLIPNDFARFYLASENVLSTETEDLGTKLEVRVGAERSLLRSWYVPALVQAEFLGNQDLSQASLLVTGGVRTILPWAWTRAALFNDVVKAPLSPVFEVAPQYVHLIRVDSTLTPDADRDTARVQGQVTWSPIYLFPGMFGEYAPLLEILAKGWWFADEGATATGKQWAGRVEASLLIPLTVVKGFGLGPILKTVAGGINGRIRLKYTNGANEANGYKNSSDFTVSMEVIQ